MSGRLCTASSLRYAPIRGSVGEVEAVAGVARLPGVGSPKGGRGEEWYVSWEWKQALIDDVLARWIPAGAVVLEIGPGAGRWSEFLVERASGLVLVDVNERPRLSAGC